MKSIDAWSWQDLNPRSLVRRILMLEDAWGLSPFCRLHLVVRLSKGRRILMLEADRGPSPFCWLHLVVRPSKGRLENIDSWRCLGALPFLSTAFGGNTIKGSENIDAWNWLGALPPLSIAFGSEAIKALENIYQCLKQTGDPPLSYTCLVAMLSNVGEYRCLRALPFLLITFGGEAIQRVW